MEAVENVSPNSDLFSPVSTCIDLVIDNVPGTIARVVASLRPCGLRFVRHSFSDCEDPHCTKLKIIAQGEATAQDLSAVLVTIQGVMQVVNVEVDLEAPAFGKLPAH